MVDYRRIHTGPSLRCNIEPEDMLALHRRTHGFLDATLVVAHAGPTVFVTHHAPHPKSLPDPQADLRWCDASDLRDLIHVRGLDLWGHGHVHHASNYWVGRAQIVVYRMDLS
ncbi:hypothetical protein MBRA_05683 [Methylobacterium brachiatum]|nr:hypothetical protein MBRA_05683 [Methylobacterium brachiatum]